jgi:hypothetical protein
MHVEEMRNGLILSSTVDGSIKAEQLVEGVVTDRMIFHDRFTRPLRPSKMRNRVIELLNEPSAEIEILVPPVPVFEPTRVQALTEEIVSAEASANSLFDQHEALPLLEAIDRLAGHVVVLRQKEGSCSPS